MSIDWGEILGGTVRVIIVGALLGAGLPALFATGMLLWDLGEGGKQADGTVLKPRRPLVGVAWAIFAIAALVVLYGLLFMTKKSIEHYLGITLPI